MPRSKSSKRHESNLPQSTVSEHTVLPTTHRYDDERIYYISHFKKRDSGDKEKHNSKTKHRHSDITTELEGIPSFTSVKSHKSNSPSLHLECQRPMSTLNPTTETNHLSGSHSLPTVGGSFDNRSSITPGTPTPLLKSKLSCISKSSKYKKSTERDLDLLTKNKSIDSIDNPKLQEAQDQLKKLEAHVKCVELKASEEQQQMKTKLESLERELVEILGSGEQNLNSVNSPAEIEQEESHEYLQLWEVKEENQKLRYENAKLTIERQELQKQVEELQIKCRKYKTDRRNFKFILTKLQDDEKTKEKQTIRPTLVRNLVLLEDNHLNGLLLDSDKSKLRAKDVLEHHFMTTTEKVRRLLQRQTNAPLPTSSETIIITLQTFPIFASNQKQLERNQSKASVAKVTTSETGPKTQQQHEDIADAIVRELFFPF